MLSLADVLNAPDDPELLNRHLQGLGLIPPPPPEPVPNYGPATVAKMSPVVPPVNPNAVKPMIPLGASVIPHAAHAETPIAPELEGAPAPTGLDVRPMTLPKLSFKEQMALPTTSAGVHPGTSQFWEGIRERQEAEKQNPYGSAENHPGLLGKIAHYAAKAGNIAGDVLAPGTMELIPGTELNKRAQETTAEEQLANAQKRETTEEAVKQRPEIAEITGEMRATVEAAKDAAALAREKSKEGSAEKIATGKEGSAEKQTHEKVEGQKDIATGKQKSAETIARENAESRERIAVGRNLAMTEAARIRAAQANDPNKLTNTMKTMKQQAQATLPGIERALNETEKVAGLLGPGEGRWNDFWSGKIGAGENDSNFTAFKHYKDEIGMVSSAVTLAHARGRMSNELFEHFEKMFDAGKQSAPNMIQALNVAHEWLSDYAKMGEEGAPGGAGVSGGAKAPPEGKVSVYSPNGEQHFVLKNKVDDFLKDPKYKGWSKNAPAAKQ